MLHACGICEWPVTIYLPCCQAILLEAVNIVPFFNKLYVLSEILFHLKNMPI